MIIKNENSMLHIAAVFAQYCQPPLVIYLSGELGAGKTTFVRGFIKSLGYEGTVKSPTYTLVESYLFLHMQVFHFDLYRVQDTEELELIGIREYFNEKVVCLIEWAEQGKGKIPSADIQCKFYIENTARKLEFIAHSIQGDKIIKEFMTELKSKHQIQGK